MVSNKRRKKRETKPDTIPTNESQNIDQQNLSCGDRLLREKEVFQLLGIAESTGQQMRLKGVGPKFVKLGRMVRYRESDVREYIQNLASRTSTGDTGMED